MNASNIVTVAIADLWKRTPPAARRAFEQAAAQDMQRFKAEMRAWKGRQQHTQAQAVHAYEQQDQAGPSSAAGTPAKPPAAGVAATNPHPPSPPPALLSPSPPPMPPRPQKRKPSSAAAAAKSSRSTSTSTSSSKAAAAAKAQRKSAAPAPALAPSSSKSSIPSSSSSPPQIPGMPRKPPGAFLLWSHKPRGELRRQKNPQLDNGAVSRILGERWRRLTQEEKAPWIALANARLEAYLVEKRACLQAAGLPLPGTTRAHNRRRKAAAAATAAASTVSAASLLPPLAPPPAPHGGVGVPVRLPPLPSASSASSAAACKAEEKAEREEDEEEAAAAAEADRQRAFWAAGGYASSSLAVGVTGAGHVSGEENGGGAFDGAMLLGGGEGEDDVAGAFCLLDMDFSDIADEIFCDSPGGPLHGVVG